MEIAPVPHRSTTRGERRRLALGLLLTVPVVVLVLLPAVLGLDRYVVTESAMGGTMSRGSVVLAREVPASDLVVGDVVSFTADSGSDRGHRVTRRIASIDGDVATTRGDAADGVDPWVLHLDGSGYARVWLSVPYVGYPFVVDGGWLLLVLAALLALLVAYVAGRRARVRHAEQSRRAAAARSARPRLPVA